MLGSIVWSCCGRRTVSSQSGLRWLPLWQPAHALPLLEGLTQHCRQTTFSITTDPLFNWTLNRLIFSVPCLAHRSLQRGKSNTADHTAKLNPSKPAAQMLTLTRLTDDTIGTLFKCVLIFSGVIPVIHPGTPLS